MSRNNDSEHKDREQSEGMRRVTAALFLGTLVAVPSAYAQAEPGRAPAQPAAPSQQKLREARYQIGQMERLLEGAVEHGATVIRDRLQASVSGGDMLLTETARARGFRLEGYGVFFDVEVPSLEGTLFWNTRALDQNGLELSEAWQRLKTMALASGTNDVDTQQALRRIELVLPVSTNLGKTTAEVLPPDAANPALSATPQLSSNPSLSPNPSISANATPPLNPPSPSARRSPDPILANPNESYRAEVREALIDAMLEHSRGLALEPAEWLTVAARRMDARPRLGIDTDAGTVVLRVRGSDLTAFLGGQITRQDARNRFDVRVF